ncbi:MAG TPA: NnrS family protein [Thiobacillaceae bacterium]|nr:NnrS family protein [Thiobacillaceae bacterium]HNU63140.1 NnrS family protein [Thiobacillaceae bacterium]
MSQSASTPQAMTGASGPVPKLPNWPLLRLGFRPFYLGTALVACTTVPLWIAVFLGYMPLRLSFPGVLWHAHEMLFGFGGAVVAGFLLTAVRAWTALPTPRGPRLAILVLIWLAARLASVLAPYWLFALLDVVFLPVVGVMLMRQLLLVRNRRNQPVVALLLLMALVNVVFHLSVLEILPVPALSVLYAQLSLIIMLLSLMAGRLVPMFTKTVTPGLVIDMPPRFEQAVLGVSAATLTLWVLGAPGALVGGLALVAAVLHAVRLWKWHPRVTLKRPVLWILHLSYAWMPVGFLLLALAHGGWVVASLAVHAFGVGVMGGFVIGMMTRTARGHTARPLLLSRGEVLAYALVMLAAVLRVLVPAVQPDWYARAMDVASVLWALAFLIFLVIYTPWLMRTRLDGQDG